jgi:hypothetical protein
MDRVLQTAHTVLALQGGLQGARQQEAPPAAGMECKPADQLQVFLHEHLRITACPPAFCR